MNRLAQATSPYLQQHAGNPVDWYEWGPEALERARREKKPILLSIGYAACHWCHVMAHESFENADIAALMNAHFVNIKVDREERPDLDAIYMQAVQAMTGHGGWPMTVFLTPDGLPFYGGTYWPPSDRHGMPGFPRVLRTLHDAYHNQPDAIRSTTSQVQSMFAAVQSPGAREAVTPATLERVAQVLAAGFDPVHAGFGGAPKFPPTMALEFLLTRWARSDDATALDMVVRTFRAMTRGGIYDQVGGGLHRYSVDARWLVPHFEKMLYDNALLLRLGVHLMQATGDQEAGRICAEIVAWVAREMTSPEGGFYSSLDADSEGHEGTFYVWSESELAESLGEDAALAAVAWGVTPAGNFEGRNVLHRPIEMPALAEQFGIGADEAAVRLARARTRLAEKRAHRVWPARDDKVVAAWNGLMLRAVAEYARVADDPPMTAMALASGRFLLAHLVRDGRVHRAWRAGRTLELGFLEDQGAVGLAMLELYTLTADTSWLAAARTIAERSVRDFFDRERGVFFDTPSDHEPLVTRPRDSADNATPAGASLVAELLQRLAVVDARDDWAAVSREVVEQSAEPLVRHPQAFGHLSVVADATVHGTIEVAVIGEPGHAGRAALERVAHTAFLPGAVLISATDETADETALGRGRRAVAGQPMAYVCRRYVCDAPTGDAGVLSAQLRQALVAASRQQG